MIDYKLSSDIAEISKNLNKSTWIISVSKSLVDHNFSWSDDTAEKFVTRIDALCSPLLDSKRKMGPIVFTFESSKLLIVSHGPIRISFVISGSIHELDELAKGAHTLILKYEELIYSHSGTKKIDSEEKFTVNTQAVNQEEEKHKEQKAAEQKAAEQKAAEQEAAERKKTEKAELAKIESEWQEFEDFLIQLLGKVIPVSQAPILIDSAKEKVSPDTTPKRKQFAPLAHIVMQQVSHKSKRQALEHEVDEYLNP